jgi:hypothetical protein
LAEDEMKQLKQITLAQSSTYIENKKIFFLNEENYHQRRESLHFDTKLI